MQSRYYNAEWGRFINADSLIILFQNSRRILSINLFSYCENNPIKYIDPNGYGVITIHITKDFIRDFITASTATVAGVIAGIIVASSGGTAAIIAPIIASGLGWIVGGSFARARIHNDIWFSVSIWFLRSKTITVY